MHISIQVCSIIIVQFLAIIFSRQKKLGTRSERIFLEILIITLISLVFDIGSVAAKSIIKKAVRGFWCWLFQKHILYL